MEVVAIDSSSQNPASQQFSRLCTLTFKVKFKVEWRRTLYIAPKVLLRSWWKWSQSIPRPQNPVSQEFSRLCTLTFEVNFKCAWIWPSRSNSSSNDGERSSAQSIAQIKRKVVAIDSPPPNPASQEFSRLCTLTFKVKFKVKWWGML